MKIIYVSKKRKGNSKSFVSCWCCHNEVYIDDSGECPICGATN